MLNRLAEAIDFSIVNGLLKLNNDHQVVHAPFTLNPYGISRLTLDGIVSLTTPSNQLMLRVAADEDLLQEHLAPSAKTDPFVQELLKLHQVGLGTQDYQLMVTRNDFLLHQEQEAPELLYPKQVEFNTISCSFPFLSARTNHLHQFLYRDDALGSQLVYTDPLIGVAAALAEAIERYGHAQACVLSVIQPDEHNIFDQRGMEYLLLEQYDIPTIRMTLEEIASVGHLHEGHLMVGNHVAAITYFRAAYTPQDFSTKEAWKGRHLIEASSSMKVPSIPMQLAGMKKIQQVLTHPKIIRKFVEEDTARRLEATFTGIYALDELIESRDSPIPAWQQALETPEHYVLKPQREGGGNNFFGEEIVQELQAMTEVERRAYILMDRIHAETHEATLVVEGQTQTTQCVSEIGCYGVCLAHRSEIIFNQDVGYLVRTKSADQNEGGVCAGYACLNSLYLKS